jgi:hydroxymethylpyrimidine kinase / phosphomethylpyrimidine kinase / thiamine-phosphate diphosphorylase
MTEVRKRPLIWSLAASDSCAGAGIQADLAMAHALQVDCATLVTAITAQSSHGVQAAYTLPLQWLEQQWQALLLDGIPSVIKLGWIPPEKALVDWLVEHLQCLKQQEPAPLVVWDPVLGASQGGLQSAPDELMPLLPLVDFLTPNRREAVLLTAGNRAADNLDMPDQELLDQLLETGVGSVLLTGGDKSTDDPVTDLFAISVKMAVESGQPECLALDRFVVEHPRLQIVAHGSGCHLASALAAALARGERYYDAVLTAIAAAVASMEACSWRASGYHNAFATAPDALAAQVLSLDGHVPLVFPSLKRGLGLYGLVDNLEGLKQLLELGIDTLQWRVKTLQDGFREDMAEAVRLCRTAGVPLFINDHWQLAIELGAFGVHLGQEDLATADLGALAIAGVALGVSTHTEWEIQRALALQPSYIAFGPVYKPLSKTLKYPPLGIERLSDWVSRFGQHQRLTCIGGITTGNIDQVSGTGIESVAIVTELRLDAGLPERFARLRQSLPAVSPVN